jgi:hypothetical protein
MFDVLQHVVIGDVTPDGYRAVEVEPANLYPSTIRRIVAVLAQGQFPDELIDPTPVTITSSQGLRERIREMVGRGQRVDIDVMLSDPAVSARHYLAQARAVDPRAWDWALQDRRRWPRDPQHAEVMMRARALEVARLWFTHALHNAIEEPVMLHILKDDFYKL